MKTWKLLSLIITVVLLCLSGTTYGEGPSYDTILIQPTTGPAGTLRNDYTGNLGNVFRVTEHVSVTKLAYYDYGDNGLAASHTLRLYESDDNGATGTVLDEVTIPAGTGAPLSDGFRWVDLSSPITLKQQIGTDWYMLTATVASGDGDSWYNHSGAGFTYNSYLNTVYYGARYTPNQGAFPDWLTGDNTMWYVVNMSADTLPLPSPTISLDKSSYYSTEDITITWSGGPASEGDRVALYQSCAAPAGIGETESGPPLSWLDISATSGNTTIDNVLVPGDYVAVYTWNGVTAVSNLVNFSVSAGPATGRDIEPKMLISYCDGGLADPQIYKEGSTYYITGTSSGAWGPIYSTDDFVTINTQWMEIDTTPWPYGYQHIWAFEIYKHTDGTYHGYGYDFDRGGLYHFEPDPDPATTTFPVLRWKEKEFLTWDYDSKVIHDGTDLWLFSAYQSEGSGHIPTYVHRMSDPGTIDTSYTPHRVMSENGDWLTSELRNRMGGMKIHEGMSPVQVSDGTTTKWVAPYTVGDYANRRYKIAFGYSNSLVPPGNGEYTKVTKADTQNVWASGAGANEVVYVTQTEKPSWPNYHAAIYGNPGSGDIFYYSDGYYMLFHATQPMMMDDMAGGSSYFGRSLWVVPLDFDFSGSMDTWASLDIPNGQAGPVLTPSKASFAPDEDIVINFENAGQGAWDQIRLHNDGAGDGSFLDWNYVQGLSQSFLASWGGDVWTWENTTYGFSGSMTFAGFSTPGDYDARFFFVGNTVGASCDFTIINTPPAFNSDPVVKPSATKGLSYNETLSGDASDPDVGQTLTFSLISSPSWLAVASNGQLSGVPDIGDVGPNVFTVRVTDSLGLYDEATLNIEVIDAGSLPPTWNSDPIFKVSAVEGLDYAGMLQTLSGGASDPDVGDVLTFSLVSAPTWLTVASDGQLSGIAADGDTGSNAFTVRVTDDGGLYDDATLNVYVASRYTGELGMSDLQAFVGRWLDTGCGACGGADLNDDGDVNMLDWGVLSECWLK